jgi:glycosyltransferase involved in cell wall biosynthesis
VKVALDVSAVPVHLAGAGRYIGELATRLPALGVQSTLVTRRADADRWRRLSPHSSVAAIVPDARALRLLYEAWALGTSVPARGSDVWHAPHYTMPHRGATPTVVTIHDLTFFTNPEWHERSKVAFFKRAITYSARHAKVLISVSDFTARQIEEFLPGHGPVVVAPHGVDLARFSPEGPDDDVLFDAAGLSTGVAYVLFVGTIEPRKGLDVLLDAFEDLSRENDALELWLAGQAGWGLKDFEGRLARHPAAPRIRRLGFVDEELLPALLRRSSAVAYPSRGEGFGLPVLEAMACGASVVTTQDTVMAEVAGNCAELTRAGDPVALAEALRAVLASDGAQRELRSALSRERAETFTWEFSMARHLAAYELARAGA